MAKVKDMTTEELELFIEQKLLEIAGDPDSDLPLSEDFRKKIQERAKKPGRRISHSEVLKRFG